MAPETLLFGRVSKASDVYAVSRQSMLPAVHCLQARLRPPSAPRFPADSGAPVHACLQLVKCLSSNAPSYFISFHSLQS